MGVQVAGTLDRQCCEHPALFTHAWASDPPSRRTLPNPPAHTAAHSVCAATHCRCPCFAGNCRTAPQRAHTRRRAFPHSRVAAPRRARSDMRACCRRREDGCNPLSHRDVGRSHNWILRVFLSLFCRCRYRRLQCCSRGATVPCHVTTVELTWLNCGCCCLVWFDVCLVV